MPKSRIFLNLSAIALCVSLFAAQAKAQSAPVPTAVQQTMVSTAVVESVDLKTRQVLLTGPSGNLVTVVAGPEVRNLDQVKAGDHLVLTAQRAVAARLSAPGASLPGPAAETGALRSARGELPAGATYTVVDVHVRIDTVDPKTHVVSFTRADGSAGSITVQNPAMQKFAAGLKPGDNVEILYLQALTIQVKKAA